MITVIIPVLNEADNICGVLEALMRQTLPPDEVIVVDGGSTDDTVELLTPFLYKLPLLILSRPHGNISISRNLAVRVAHNEIIAATDAGTRVHPTWLAEITAPLRTDKTIQMVGGFYQIQANTLLQNAIGAIDSRLPDQIDPQHFLPHSRSIAFRKSAWQQVGGYPEWLDYCEDLIFAWRIKFGYNLPTAFAPNASLAYEPSRTLRQFFWQYFRYARGDGKAGLWWKRHSLRYFVYLILLPLTLLAGATIHSGLFLLLVVLGFVYVYKPLLRLRHLTSSPLALFWIPVVRLVGDIAKMIGYPCGLRWRFSHQLPNWRDC